MKHNKMIIAAVAACIVLSSATIGAQSWKRSLGKLKQGVEQVTRQSKPNTTRQSGDVQVPEWHEERAQKRTSGLPAAVDTVIEHLRYGFIQTTEMPCLWASTTSFFKKRKQSRSSAM